MLQRWGWALFWLVLATGSQKNKYTVLYILLFVFSLGTNFEDPTLHPATPYLPASLPPCLPRSCGMSLGRIGLDLRPLLPPLFEGRVLSQFAAEVAAAPEAYRTALDQHRWLALSTAASNGTPFFSVPSILRFESSCRSASCMDESIEAHTVILSFFVFHCFRTYSW